MNIEKIIAKHLQPEDMYLEVERPKYVGVVAYTGNQYKTIKQVPKSLKRLRYLRIKAGLVRLEVKPLGLSISANRIYNKGKLQKIDKTVLELENYIRSCPHGLLNRVMVSSSVVQARGVSGRIRKTPA